MKTREQMYEEVADWEQSGGSRAVTNEGQKAIGKIRQSMRENGWDPRWISVECFLAEDERRWCHHSGDYQHAIAEESGTV